MVCMFCDDPYSPERVLSPLLLHKACFLTGDRSIVIETFLGDSKRKVEVSVRVRMGRAAPHSPEYPLSCF